MYRIYYLYTFTINLSQIKVYKSSSFTDPLCMLNTTVDGGESLQQLIGCYPNHSQGFKHRRWLALGFLPSTSRTVIPSHPDIPRRERPPEPYPAALGVAFGASATAASWDAPFRTQQTNKNLGAARWKRGLRTWVNETNWWVLIYYVILVL